MADERLISPEPAAASPSDNLSVYAPADRARPWHAHWFGVADVVFLVLVIGIGQHCKAGMLDDPGLGWHIRNVDAMIAEGWWLTTDSFSGPRGGERWYANQWLGDVCLWLGERWGGLEGIAAVTALVMALALRSLFRFLIEEGISWPEAVLWTWLATSGTSMSWVARPNVFTLWFAVIAARTCIQFHAGACSKQATLWLVPLFMIWSNTHGGFIAGLIILGTTWATETALGMLHPEASVRQSATVRRQHWTLICAACILATFANPYGVGVYEWNLRLLGDEYATNLHSEWKVPDFHGPLSMRYEILMLAFPVLLAFSRRRPNLVSLALAIVWLHYAFQGRRYIAIWILIVVPLLARAAADLPIRDFLRERLKLSDDWRAFLASRPDPAPWLGTFVVAIGLLGWAKLVDGAAGHNPELIPAKSLNYLIEHYGDRRLFHHYDWGGYLTWKGWPKFKNWIDDRYDVQGREHVEKFLAIEAARPGWRDLLRADDIEVVAMPPKTNLVAYLKSDPDWDETYRDRYAVIFVRNKPWN